MNKIFFKEETLGEKIKKLEESTRMYLKLKRPVIMRLDREIF